MDNLPALKVDELSCSRQQKTVFTPISFQLRRGEVLLIEGPNGSGKSSLLRLLSGLATPTQGEITWQNKSIQTDLAEYAEQLHYLGHKNGIKLGLTVVENLMLAAQLANTPIAVEEMDAILKLLKLHAHKDVPAENLSAGQKRRIALAKIFLVPKLLWLLDEPLTALDQATQQFFFERLETHLQNNGLAIISSHHAFTTLHANMQTLRLT